MKNKHRHAKGRDTVNFLTELHVFQQPEFATYQIWEMVVDDLTYIFHAVVLMQPQEVEAILTRFVSPAAKEVGALSITWEWTFHNQSAPYKKWLHAVQRQDLE
jgi:hypothetical protein